MENKEYKYCKRCHRQLKDEQSRKLGYGKICYSKINKNNLQYLFTMEVTNETNPKEDIQKD